MCQIVGTKGYITAYHNMNKTSTILVLPTDSSVSVDNDSANITTIKGIIFDMDGTLTRPQTWMFGEMRRQLAVPDGVDILTHLESLPTPELRHDAERKLRLIEEKAMNEQQPTVGLLDTFQKLHSIGVKTSICTRNVPKPVSDFCKKFLDCDPYVTSTSTTISDPTSATLISGPVVTREFKPPKPSPKPLLHIIETWGVNPGEVLMVGDSHDDMDAGLSAGCAVVLLRHEDNENVETLYATETGSRLHGVAHDLHELHKMLQNGIVL